MTQPKVSTEQKALPPSKRDFLRAYLSALRDDLFDRGLVSRVDTAQQLAKALWSHFLVEAGRDFKEIVVEDVLPSVAMRGAAVAARGLGVKPETIETAQAIGRALFGVKK